MSRTRSPQHRAGTPPIDAPEASIRHCRRGLWTLLILGLGAACLIALVVVRSRGSRRYPPPPLEIREVNAQQVLQIDAEAMAEFACRHGLSEIPDLASLPLPAARTIHAALEGIGEHPDQAEAWAHLGRVYQSHRLPAQALVCYERACGLDPQAFEWVYHKAHAHEELLQTAEALQAYERSLELKPDYASTSRHLGTLYLQQGELEKAEQAFQRFIKLRPDQSHGYLGLAQVAVERQDLRAAQQSLEKALARDEEDFRVHHLLGQTYQQLGDTARAQEHLARARTLTKRVIVDDPLYSEMIATNTGADALEVRMRAAMGAGQPAEAIWLGEEICRQVPGDARRLRNLALAYKQAGRFPEALDRIDQAVGADPGYLDAQVTRAELLLTLARPEEALERLDWVITQDPNSYSAHFYRGFARMRLQQFEGGIESFREATRISDGSAQAHFYLAEALATAGRREEALAEYRRVIELEPGNAAARQRLAELTMDTTPAP